MWIILILFVAGTVAGILLSRNKRFNPFAEKMTGYAIYLLLFFMGLSVGSNPGIMKNLDKIGLESITIALFALGGSIIFSGLLWFLFFKNEK